MSSRRLYPLISIFVIPGILMGCARDEDEAARIDQTLPGKELITSPPHKVYPFEPTPEKFQEYMNSRTWRGGSTRVTFMYLQDCKETTEFRIQLNHWMTGDAILKYIGSYGYGCDDGFARVTDPTGTDTCEVSVSYTPVIDTTFYSQEYEIWSKKNPTPKKDDNRWSYEENKEYLYPELEKKIEADYQERLSNWKSKQYWLIDQKLQKLLPHIERWEYKFSCHSRGSHGIYLPENYGGTIGRRSNPQ